VHSALPLRFDGLQLGCPTFADRLPMNREVARPVIGPTDRGETQEIEGFGFPFAPLLPALRSEAPEFDQARLLRVEFQPELRHSLPEFCQKALGFYSVLELGSWRRALESAYGANRAQTYAETFIPRTKGASF
jgi:hypothetical protein